MPSTTPKTLVVYDFDWSFVDQDTDRWVFEVLSTELRRTLQTRKSGGSQCTPDVVEETMRDLWQAGFKKEQILEALRQLPVHPAQIRAVTALKKRMPSTEFICLSNSNYIYIGTILEHHKLTELFSTIITNPAHWDEEHSDLFHVGRRLPADGPQHSCKVACLVNMCKGDELDAYLAQRSSSGTREVERVIYVGDGENDFCPLLRMREGDLALVRKGYELEQRIKDEGGLKCDVKYWTQAWEIDEIFSKLQ